MGINYAARPRALSLRTALRPLLHFLFLTLSLLFRVPLSLVSPLFAFFHCFFLVLLVAVNLTFSFFFPPECPPLVFPKSTIRPRDFIIFERCISFRRLSFSGQCERGLCRSLPHFAPLRLAAWLRRDGAGKLKIRSNILLYDRNSVQRLRRFGALSLSYAISPFL